jgi:hypothetical protein
MRPLLNGMRALMDKNGVVMERFETFRMWEFIRGHQWPPDKSGRTVEQLSSRAVERKVVGICGHQWPSVAKKI